MRILLLLLTLQAAVDGCECARSTPCDLLDREAIFIGEVVDGGISSVLDDPWYSKVSSATFRVLERFRGVPANQETVEVTLFQMPGMCAPIPYYRGKRYLVALNRWNGQISDGGCFSQFDADAELEDVRVVRDYFHGRLPLQIRGQVVAGARNPDLAGYYLMTGGGIPASGATVSARIGDQSLSAVTDSEGKYVLPVPFAGVYRLKTLFDSYPESPAVEVRVPAKGCAVRDLGVPAFGQISGVLREADGQLARKGKVGLIRVGLEPGAKRETFMRTAHVERGDGFFVLEAVPIGKYLVVTNPDGPEPEPPYDLERTYYPGASPRAKAEVIEVTAASPRVAGLDITKGAPVRFRDVTVRVSDPEGKPLKSIQVWITGAGAELENWNGRDLERVVERKFRAPVNRRLTIEAADWYGRDLKAEYKSIHEPGEGPIRAEFVIRDQ